MCEFLKYQSNCPFAKFGLKDGYLSEFELTCRRKDNIPAGHSWGICDEKHCPEFGEEIQMKDIVIRNTDSGEVIGVAESATCRAVELPNTMREFVATLREPKVIARIKICGGGLTFTITDNMQFEIPTPEQCENLKKTFGIEVELVEG